jgi:hypothetical protein
MNGRSNHQTPNSFSEEVFASVSRSESNNDSMDLSSIGRRNGEGQPLGTFPIEKDSIWKARNPPFCATNLIS